MTDKYHNVYFYNFKVFFSKVCYTIIYGLVFSILFLYILTVISGLGVKLWEMFENT